MISTRAHDADRLVLVDPGYAGYQKKTSRNIPVVICEPRPGPVSG